MAIPKMVFALKLIIYQLFGGQGDNYHGNFKHTDHFQIASSIINLVLLINYAIILQKLLKHLQKATCNQPENLLPK